MLLAALTGLLVVRARAPFPVDTASHVWLVSHRTTALTAAARAVSITGTGVPAYALAALAGAGLAATLRLRRWTAALVGVLAILAGQAVRVMLAWSVDRPRPPRLDWATSASGPSFPSGHSTTSALVAGLVCIAASYGLGASGRRLVQGAAVAWTVAVGQTRIYLGVHWLTDVLGGWLLAMTLVPLAAQAVQRRGRQGGSSLVDGPS